MKNQLSIINLIQNGYSLNDISQILSISLKQLSVYTRELTNKGFDFQPKYYSNGEILYNINKNLELEPSVGTPIYTSPKENEITLIAISDLHLGNQLSNIRAINTIYDYCINNDIHIIINAGDVFDALTFGNHNLKKYNNYTDLFEKSIHEYPQDKSIINFLVLGNHDVDSLINTGQNVATYLKNYRQDIVPIGYGIGEILLKNSTILIKHSLKKTIHSTDKKIQDYSFVLKGHGHQTNLIDNGTPQIGVPSLSNLKFNGNELPPEALKITIKFNEGHIYGAAVSQLLIKNKVYQLNNLQLNIKEGKHPIDEPVKYEEVYKKRILKK